MALFGCGRDERGGMAGVGVFAASAALDRLLGVAEKDEAPLGPSWVQRVFSRFQPNAPAPAPSRAVVNPRISVERRDAFLAAVPLLKHLQQGEANASFACADFDVYCVKVSAAWSKNVSLTSVAGAHSFQLARKVLRPQFDLVKAARPRPLDVWGNATVRVALHVRRGDVMPVDKGDRGAREGAAWGLPLKAQCKAVELAAYWPCLRAYLESRANETARVVVVSTAGRADLPGADDAPVPDVAYLADRPPPPCFPASFFATSAGPDDSTTTRDIRPQCAPSTRSNPPTLCAQAGDAAVERARRCDRARFGRDGVGDGHLLLAGLVDGPARRGARARRRPSLRGVFCPRPFVLFDLLFSGLAPAPTGSEPRLRRERYPPDAIDAISRRRVPTQVRSHAKGCGGVGAACHRLKSHKRGGGVYTASSPSSLPS